MPSTVTGGGPSGSTSSAYATNASCAIFQSMPNSAATPDTGRQWSPIDCAAARRARVVILARAGMSAGSDSVNTFRSHSGTRQCHFRLCHNNTGRSGPIRTSLGRVVTHSFGDDDCCRHTGHHPANSGSVEQCTTRRPASSISTDSTINPSIPNNSELLWSMLVVLRSDCLRTTSFEGHGPLTSPTRRRADQAPSPTKWGWPEISAGRALPGDRGVPNRERVTRSRGVARPDPSSWVRSCGVSSGKVQGSSVVRHQERHSPWAPAWQIHRRCRRARSLGVSPVVRAARAAAPRRPPLPGRPRRAA